MAPPIDITGQKFGRLTAIRRVERPRPLWDLEGKAGRFATSGGEVLWLCDCDCGGTLVTTCYELRKGLRRSCGCLRKERLAKEFLAKERAKQGEALRPALAEPAGPDHKKAGASSSLRTVTKEKISTYMSPMQRRRELPRKTCARCGVDKLEDEFYPKTDIATNPAVRPVRTASTCKTCYKARMQSYRRAKKDAKRTAAAPALVVVDEAPATAPAPAPVVANEQPLSELRIRQLADWYADRAYRDYSPDALAAGALDAELRAILAREVDPERVEVEFTRVVGRAR